MRSGLRELCVNCKIQYIEGHGGLPWWSDGEESALQGGGATSIPSLGESHMPWGTQACAP